MADRNLDEYKNVKFYAENTKAKKAGFSKFNLDRDYYFCRYVDGDIAMISQAYSSEAGRNNGIESVKKNEKLAKRYIFEERGAKKHGFVLKAGNGQEIAISPDYDSLAKAKYISGRLSGKTRPSKSASKSAATKKSASKPKTKKSVTKLPVDPKAAFTAIDQRIENYRPLAFYRKHGGKAAGFNRFEHDGAYYFHYNQGDEIVLISESYTSKSGRDNGIASVKNNMPIEKAYQHHIHKNGKHYFDLNAGNGQEIATSRWYSSNVKSRDAAASLRGGNKVPRKGNVEQNYMPLAFYKKHTSSQENGFESFKGEDGEHYFVYFENNKIALISEGYPTAAVRDKGLASVEKNMTNEDRYFYGTGADGKEGFALRAGNNKEIARSVGYGSAGAALAGAAYLLGTRQRVKAAKPIEPVRSAEVKPAPMDTPQVAAAAVGVSAVASTIKAEPVVAAPVTAATPSSVPSGGVWRWLKWVLLGLLALLALFFIKSCFGGEKAVKAAPIETTSQAAAPAAMVTCWNDTKAKSLQACPAKVTCWDNSFAISMSACPAKPVAESFECWDGSKAVNQAGCPIKPAKTKTVAGTAIATTAPKISVGKSTSGKMTAPSVRGRICGPSAQTLFNVTESNPKTVSYLGSKPQFGNSLSLTPNQFYQKLATAHQTSSNDRAFLNLFARSLGYGSFRDMDSSMFSDDRLTNGTSGLLGFGAQHALQYSTLNVRDQTDLEAFRVKSANGTDVHFMKRCGNYMYVCQP